MSLLGGIVSGLFGLAGAKVAKPKTTSAGQNIQSHVAGVMKAAAQYKINPLTLLGSVSPIGPTSDGGNPQLGQVFQDAGAMLADGMARKASTYGQLEQARALNSQLNQRLQKLTLRPPVAGIYGEPSGGGDVSASGDRDSGAVSAGGDTGELEPIDVFVPYRWRDGSITYGPNPKIPDIDQMLTPGTLGVYGAPDVAARYIGAQTGKPLSGLVTGGGNAPDGRFYTGAAGGFSARGGLLARAFSARVNEKPPPASARSPMAYYRPSGF